jgi:hypothetical protein
MVADDVTLCYVFKFQVWLQCASCKFLTCHIDEFQFFYRNRRGRPLLTLLKYKKGLFTKPIKQKENKKGKPKPPGTNHPMLCSHCFISLALLSFALCITKVCSFLKTSLQCPTEGSSLPKSEPFLSFQIHHVMIIIISIAKGTPKVLFKCLVARSGLSHPGTTTPICIQQVFAKEHLKNKCLFDSSTCFKQSSHE